jgi:hypothetical protein
MVSIGILFPSAPRIGAVLRPVEKAFISSARPAKLGLEMLRGSPYHGEGPAVGQTWEARDRFGLSCIEA